MVFVENPVVGRQLAAGEECAVVESVKAASDVYAPIAGVVLAANTDVEASPESINQDAYAAWMFTLKPANAADLDGLLDAAGYEAHIASEAH
jgi:glycine cleavage system H protein